MNAAFKRIKPGSPLTPASWPSPRELEALALAKKTAPAKPVNTAWNQDLPAYLHRRNDTSYPEVFK